MANRLSIITTRGGDKGTTGLGDGTRVSKSSPRISALGDVDELNSYIGVVRTQSLEAQIEDLLSHIQHDLFELGAELCIPGHTALKEQNLKRLDDAIAGYNADLGKLKEFILPGGCVASAHLHVARAVCRRAERSVTFLSSNDTVSPLSIQYLNRLSDLLFVLARYINKATGNGDVLWTRS